MEQKRASIREIKLKFLSLEISRIPLSKKMAQGDVHDDARDFRFDRHSKHRRRFRSAALS